MVQGVSMPGISVGKLQREFACRVKKCHLDIVAAILAKLCLPGDTLQGTLKQLTLVAIGCRWRPGLGSQWASCRRNSRAGMSSMIRALLLPDRLSAAYATTLYGAPTSSC